MFDFMVKGLVITCTLIFCQFVENVFQVLIKV